MECNTSHLELKKHLAAMLRKSGALVGLPIVEVGAGTHTESAINCENSHLTFEDFVRLCIGVDACGKPALRVKNIASCNTLTTCANNDDANPLGKMFAFDSSTKTYALVLNKSV